MSRVRLLKKDGLKSFNWYFGLDELKFLEVILSGYVNQTSLFIAPMVTGETHVIVLTRLK